MNHFLDLNNEKYHAKKIFSNDALKFLAGCSYRGNVRELRNVVERMVIMSREDEITLSDASIAFAAMNVNEQGLPEEAAETEDFIFGEGSLKEKVAAYERKLLQQYMAKYKSGAKVAYLHSNLRFCKFFVNMQFFWLNLAIFWLLQNCMGLCKTARFPLKRYGSL